MASSPAFYIEIDCGNFITFSQSKLDDFFRLDCDKLKEFLSDDRLVVKSEKEAFEALEQWVMHSPDDRLAEVPKLLPCIRLGQLDPFYLAGTVQEFAIKGGCASLIQLAILRTSRRLDHSANSEFRENPRRSANRFITPAARKEYESPDPNKLLNSLSTAVAQATTAYQNIEQTSLRGKAILTSLETLLIEARKYIPLPAHGNRSDSIEPMTEVPEEHRDMSEKTKQNRKNPAEYPFACDQCSKRYSAKRLLTDHHHQVHAEKRFACICSFKTNKKSHLTRHQKKCGAMKDKP